VGTEPEAAPFPYTSLCRSQSFHEALDDPEIASELEIRETKRPPREERTETAEAITERIGALREKRDRLGRQTYRLAPVTARVKRSEERRVGKEWRTRRSRQ